MSLSIAIVIIYYFYLSYLSLVLCYYTYSNYLNNLRKYIIFLNMIRILTSMESIAIAFISSLFYGVSLWIVYLLKYESWSINWELLLGLLLYSVLLLLIECDCFIIRALLFKYLLLEKSILLSYYFIVPIYLYK